MRTDLWNRMLTTINPQPCSPYSGRAVVEHLAQIGEEGLVGAECLEWGGDGYGCRKARSKSPAGRRFAL